MRRSSLLLTATALALAGAACATNGAPPAEPDLPGCYYVVHSVPGTPGGLPWGVHLTADTLAGWPALKQRGTARTAVTLTGEGRQDHPFGYWMPGAAGDSVELGYPGGGGLLLELAVSEDGRTLQGTALPLGDALPYPARPGPRERSPVTLTKARCPEEPGGD